jgi:hypothetical protein
VVAGATAPYQALVVGGVALKRLRCPEAAHRGTSKWPHVVPGDWTKVISACQPNQVRGPPHAR